MVQVASFKAHRQARVPHGADPPPLRAQGLEEKISWWCVSDHQHDAGAGWPFKFETEMNYDSLQLSGKQVMVLGLGDTGLSVRALAGGARVPW